MEGQRICVGRGGTGYLLQVTLTPRLPRPILQPFHQFFFGPMHVYGARICLFVCLFDCI